MHKNKRIILYVCCAIILCLVSSCGSITGKQETIPSSYDLREHGKAPVARDQGKYGTCWAFASLAAMESVLLPDKDMVFAPDNMSLGNPLSIAQYDGGEYTMTMAYLASWRGPILEEDDPYGDGYTPDNVPAAVHVQNIMIIPAGDSDAIKKAIMSYGGVQSSMYTLINSSEHDSKYYNKEAFAYANKDADTPNHDVVIIGWNDNFSKDNFTVDAQVKEDGAWLVLSSWGDDFGDKGCFWVSYEDNIIGRYNECYYGIEDTDNYSSIYQSDIYGWIGQIGYGDRETQCANAYAVKEDETIEAIGFYATEPQTTIETYVLKDFDYDNIYWDDAQSITTASYDCAGYYTVELKNPIDVKAGDNFAVMMKITTPGTEHPIAIEYAGDAGQIKFDIDDGEGYISSDGKTWEHVEEIYDCNLCIKAYGKKDK